MCVRQNQSCSVSWNDHHWPGSERRVDFAMRNPNLGQRERARNRLAERGATREWRGAAIFIRSPDRHLTGLAFMVVSVRGSPG